MNPQVEIHISTKYPAAAINQDYCVMCPVLSTLENRPTEDLTVKEQQNLATCAKLAPLAHSAK